MRLKTLELTGFKSFAKKTELEFEKPITAIVGPNGSGKSNVAEAFRFVLGEQSMKSMRSKRTEDLIFAGSRETGRSNRASVKVVLDNEDRLFDIDFDEVSFERIIHRDASNEYLINGSSARLKDIQELVTAANIGSSGHHIISQGEADRVLNLNSRDRKEMIEDALGLRIYHYRKKKSQRKLERTRENLDKVKSLRRELAPHIKFLEKQVERIEAAKEQVKKLESLYREYLRRESVYIRDELNKWTRKLEEPKERIEEVKKEIEEAKALSESGSASGQNMDKVLALDEEISRVREEINNISRKIGRIEGEIETQENSLERERKLRQRYVRDSVELEKVESLKDKISEVFDKETNLEAIKSEIKSIFENFLRAFRNKGGDGQVEKDAKDELGKKKTALRELEAELESLKSDEKELSKERERLKEVIESEKDKYKEAEKEVYRLQAIASDIRAKIEDYSSKLERAKLLEEEYKRELGEAGVLVGKQVTRFGDEGLRDDEGNIISEEQILSEDRPQQEDRRKQIERLKIKLEESGLGSDSSEVINEYKEAKERDEFLEHEVEDLIASSEKLGDLIEELEDTLEVNFNEGVDKINEEFEKFFKIMFGGGEASLEVRKEEVSSDDGLDEEEGSEYEVGVDIKVSLPHKRIKGLEVLSGGERALTSIALLFALSSVNPPPFIILDETDAALDEANSKRYGDMIENLSEGSQLILITHNRETMSRAGMLYGITMGRDGVSDTLSVSFDEAVEVAK